MNVEEFNRRNWRWVRVPQAVLRAPLSGTDALVWVILAKHKDNRSGVVAHLRRETVMAELGRLGHRPDVVTTATRRLSQTHTSAAVGGDESDGQDMPLLVKRHDYRSGGKTRATYGLPVHKLAGFEPLEHQALDMLQRNEVAAEDLLWLLRWRDACGSTEQTERTHLEMSQRYGAGLNTVKRHYQALVSRGLLCSHPRPGQSNLTTLPPMRALERIYDEQAEHLEHAWGSPDPWTA